MTPAVIGVFPSRALERRRRLFTILESAFAVRFVGRHAGDWHGLRLAVSFDPAIDFPQHLPFPTLTFAEDSAPEPTPASIQLTADAAIDARLRGRRFPDVEASMAAGIAVQAGDRVLALRGDDALWLSRAASGGQRQLAAIAPPELEAEATLRSRLNPGRFLALLPLIALLRELHENRPWTEPAPRACFIVDDPNLRSTAYGHLDFRELATHAAVNGYHVAIASIPLDYGRVHPRVGSVFRQSPASVSLVVHGNNHDHHELLAVDDAGDARRLTAQALRRADRFERRSGLPVFPVMCAPHEECHPAMLPALFELGFEALTLVPRSRISHDGETPNTVLAGWEPAQLIGGLPILPRFALTVSDAELAFHDYLNLPKIIFLHHGDLKAGPEVLDDIAARINRLRPHRWLSPAQIARSNYVAWREGNDLLVRLYARRVRVPVPAGIERVVLQAPGLDAGAPVRARCGDQYRAAAAAMSFSAPFDSSVEVALEPLRAVSPESIPAPAWRPWPVLRRVLTESRDRVSVRVRG